jgi:hypothetical protein
MKSGFLYNGNVIVAQWQAREGAIRGKIRCRRVRTFQALFCVEQAQQILGKSKVIPLCCGKCKNTAPFAVQSTKF